MQWNLETAENKLKKMHMEDMPLVQMRPVKTGLPQDWFSKYKKLCREFAESLTDSVETLAFMNLSQDDFMGLLMGQRFPKNISIRFRTPLLWGGGLNIENMFMCWTFPHSHNLDTFILSQSENDVIWLPNPTQKIYIPANTASGGDGGNATSDRLSQMASQMTTFDR